MDRKPNAPASPVLVSAPVDGLGVPLNLEARAAQLLDEGQAVVLLTVVEREGSAPRAAGTRALLTAAGLEGTVGGGLLEARAVEAANVCLKEGRSARVRCDLTGLGPDSDMICGGSMDLLCEYLAPAQAPLFRAADAALKAGLTGIWLLDVSRADAPVRDLYLDALPQGQPLVAGLHEGAEAVRCWPGARAVPAWCGKAWWNAMWRPWTHRRCCCSAVAAMCRWRRPVWPMPPVSW